MHSDHQHERRADEKDRHRNAPQDEDEAERIAQDRLPGAALPWPRPCQLPIRAGPPQPGAATARLPRLWPSLP